MSSSIVKNKFLRTKIKKGKSSFTKRGTKYSSIVSKYQPTLGLQEVFRALLKKYPQYGIENIDEFRKIFFTYFLFHKNLIIDGVFPAIDLPCLGKIIPGYDAIITNLNFMSSGVGYSKYSDQEVKSKFSQTLYLLYKNEREREQILINKGILNNGASFKQRIEPHYKRWVANFKKRRIYLESYDDWFGSCPGKGIFV